MAGVLPAFFPDTGATVTAAEPDSLLHPKESEVEVVFDRIIIQHIPFGVEFRISGDPDRLPVWINDSAYILPVISGVAKVNLTLEGRRELSIITGEFRLKKDITPVPLWMSVLPPLIAILIALVFREVFSALFIGLLVGTTIIMFYRGMGFFEALFNGFFAIIDTYVLESLLDFSHLSIVVFSMMIGAMVVLITENGGMKGIVRKLSAYAKSPASGQMATWLLGISIFFDDYANTLVVGNTMRPVTDRLKVSREKLSYIVDSTAAPVAAVALVTTWIGAELSYIADGISALGLDESAYTVFLQSLAYSFYPFLTLIFVGLIIVTGRDFGPMYRAEKRARERIDEDVEKEIDSNGTSRSKDRWYNAVAPVFVVITGTIAGLMVTGIQEVGWDGARGFWNNLSLVTGNSDSFRALLWSSLAGVFVAVIMTLGQRLLSLRDTMESLVSGFKTMVPAILILVLAWSIALITRHLHTADFVSRILLAIQVSPFLVPAATFVLSALVAFSTGSSWGTMAIMYPLILPSAWLIARESGLEYARSMDIFHNVVSAVLAGSVLGDHCSPISDTTILSSLASSCNHIDHVRTQLPYALIVGLVALFVGTVPAAYGIPFFVTMPCAVLILFLIIRFAGQKT